MIMAASQFNRINRSGGRAFGGSSTPHGCVLLYGPPGCGKTLFLKSTANEFSLAHELISCRKLRGEFREGIKTQMFFKKLFSHARENAPSMIILDNIEELTSKKSLNDTKIRKSVYQLLRELDHIKPGDRILITATSDYPHLIEPLLFKARRFDKLIFVPLPNAEARQEIFQMCLSAYPVENDINLKSLGRISSGYNGLDLRRIVDYSAQNARKQRVKLSMYHLEQAIRQIRPSLTPDILDPIKRFFMRYKTGTLWRKDSSEAESSPADDEDETVEFEIEADDEEEEVTVAWSDDEDDEDDEDDDEESGEDLEMTWDDEDEDEEDDEEEVEEWDEDDEDEEAEAEEDDDDEVEDWD